MAAAGQGFFTAGSSFTNSQISVGTSLLNGSRATFSAKNNLIVQKYVTDDPFASPFDLPCLHVVENKSSLYNRFTRKLVNESHGIYLSSLRLLKESRGSNQDETVLLKISQKYRSVLLVCIEDLNTAEVASDLSEEDIMQNKLMFLEIELVWHLIELLLFDTKSMYPVVYRLLDWIQWHFTEPTKKVPEILSLESPCHHPAYWDTIIQFILQGDIHQARVLLKEHETSQREDFRSLDELLKKMPLYNEVLGMSWNEFNMRWRRWQEECKRRLDEGQFEAVAELNCVCKILCGDCDTLNEKSALCSSWYHVLVSFLLYSDPCLSIPALGQMARSFSRNINQGVEFTVLDNIILSVMEFDVLTLVKNAVSFNDGLWFVAHATDLLYRGAFKNTEVESNLHALNEFLLLSYAESLMCHPSLWQIGVDYLDQCKARGREFLELYLERIPLDSELKARKILHLAKQRNLDDLSRSICKTMTMRAIENDMFGTALKWVVYSQDSKFANILAIRWVKEYTETGKFHCFEILKNLGFCMLVSDKLTFLGKYCEFHKLYQKNQFKDAAALLVSLLASGLVPKTFQVVMLLDSLPLLDQPEPVFNMQDTAQLMFCLQTLFDDGLKEDQKAAFREKERLIRLALAKNLSRAFICENAVQHV